MFGPMARHPKRTPISKDQLRGLLPSDYQLSGGDALSQQVDVEEQDLIRRVRAKATGLVPTRSPVPLPSAYGPQDGPGRIKGTLGTLLAGDGFQVTEEELNDAAEASVQGEGVDPAWEGLTKQMIRASCAFFAQEVLTGSAGEPYNGHFFISEHHEEWDDLVCNYDRICILAARDHGKTFFFNFAYPLWRASTMPWGKGFILSATASQAERILEDIIAEVEGNPKLQWLIPTRKDSRKWSSRYVRFSNGHRIYARGFGTKVRGFHPDYIIGDDVLNDETIYSDLVRRKQAEYWFTAISNMIIPGGQIIIVGTPFHQDDLYHEIEDNEEYEFRKYAAITPEGKALWPERYTLQDPPPPGAENLDRKKREIGSIRFTREFLCEPVADDMSLFPLRLFQGDPIEQRSVKLGMPGEFWDKAGVTRFIGVDFAMSSNVSADYTVVFTLGLDEYGNRWVVDIQRAKGLAYQEQLSLINTVSRKYSPALVFLEDNQMQRIFGDELIRTSDLPIRKFTTTIQKNSLDKGVPSLRVLLENKKFRIPRGDKDSVEMTDTWINEMRSFTWQDGKLQSVGGHDDTVMACWIADQAVRHGGFKFSFGEEEYEGSLDDFLDELSGTDEQPEEGTQTDDKTNKRKEPAQGDGQQQLQGEDLLRAILKKKMRGVNRRPTVQSTTVPPPKEEPGTHDLVDESEFWD